MYNISYHKCSGSVTIPPSKSVLHRALIIASLKKEKTIIRNINYSEDIKATIRALENLNIKFKYGKNYIEVIPQEIKKIDDINVNESGSTLRFMIPYCLLQNEEIMITGNNKLKERPIDAYFKMFESLNIKYQYDGKLPLKLKGSLKSGTYYIDGSKSSQFISGLLMILPFIDGNSKIIIENKLESESYVELTRSVLRDFGIDIFKTENTYYIKGNQVSNLREYKVEGDFSQASFYLVLNALGGKVKLKGLNARSSQGDRRIIDFLKMAGITFDNNCLATERNLKPFKVNLEDNPDLTPILAVLAANIKGKSEFYGLRRLAYKESNRLIATKEMLENVGVKVIEKDDSLIIYGCDDFHYGKINTYNDHRILMASTILAYKTNLSVNDIKCVNKSYPEFIFDMTKIGCDIVDTLTYARKKISAIDNDFKELFQKRMDAVSLVLDYKLENNLPVYDAKREVELKLRLLSGIDKYRCEYEDFIDNILKISKDYQKKNYYKFGLLGERLDYSLSKNIHEAFYEEKNIKAKYDLVEVKKEDFFSFMNNLKDSNYKGLNVTIPYKEKVLDHIDFLSDKAERLQNVNTIKIIDGKLYGYNTDYYGFKRLLVDNKIDIRDKDCFILGSGGAAKTCYYVLEDMGARSIKYVSRFKMGKDVLNYQDLENIPCFDIMINATPVGMNDMNSSPISDDIASKVKVGIDLNYCPNITKFMKQTNSLINGYKMLVEQAYKADMIWFNEGETDE